MQIIKQLATSGLYYPEFFARTIESVFIIIKGLNSVISKQIPSKERTSILHSIAAFIGCPVG